MLTTFTSHTCSEAKKKSRSHVPRPLRLETSVGGERERERDKRASFMLRFRKSNKEHTKEKGKPHLLKGCAQVKIGMCK